MVPCLGSGGFPRQYATRDFEAPLPLRATLATALPYGRRQREPLRALAVRKAHANERIVRVGTTSSMRVNRTKIGQCVIDFGLSH